MTYLRIYKVLRAWHKHKVVQIFHLRGLSARKQWALSTVEPTISQFYGLTLRLELILIFYGINTWSIYVRTEFRGPGIGITLCKYSVAWTQWLETTSA